MVVMSIVGIAYAYVDTAADAMRHDDFRRHTPFRHADADTRHISADAHDTLMPALRASAASHVCRF